MLTIKAQVHLTSRIRMPDTIAAGNDHLSRRMRCRPLGHTVISHAKLGFCLDYTELAAGAYTHCIEDIGIYGHIASLPQTCISEQHAVEAQ
jgi:hypothetical protein